MTRCARPITAIRRVPVVGQAASRARAFARDLGVASSRRDGATDIPVTLPWGVWPQREDSNTAAAVLGPALASYARLLERRRAPRTAPPTRGIPLLLRRAGSTATGPNHGTGGLARSMVPVDRPIAPLDARVSVDPRALLRTRGS